MSCKVGRPFSFALIDFDLAVQQDGFFMREIQARPDLAPLPVVLIDCRDSNAERTGERSEQSGSQLTMEWPVSQSALLQMISGLHPSLGDTSHSIHALSSALNPQSSKLGAAAWAGIHRILVAEDNAANQELILALLETRVPVERVQIASDGREALKAATEERFDLILMDIQMPHSSGIEATMAIRQTRHNVADQRQLLR